MHNRQFYILILIFILIFTLPTFAEDDLFITNWHVQSDLLENGDLQVSEDITFRFNDDFNGIFREIVLDNTDGVEELEVYEVSSGNLLPYNLDQNADIGDSNVYRIETEDNTERIQVYSPSGDEDKTFKFNYRVSNLAMVHSDIGEFFYKFLGGENTSFIEYFTVRLSLPDFNRDDIYIFAHGPENGTINFTNDNQIILEAQDVEANNFIEARVLYPRSYTPLSNRRGNSNLNTILSQEVRYQQDLEEDSLRKERLEDNFNKLSLILSGLGALFLAAIYRFTRRNPKIFRQMEDYNPEDISPAELNLFRNMTLSPRAISATIFDLASKGYLDIKDLSDEDKKLDLELSRIEKSSRGLLDHESFFLDWLFNEIGDGQKSSTLLINEKRKESSASFNREMQKWVKMVKDNLSNRQYYDRKYRKLGVFLLFLSIGLFALTIAALINMAYYGVALLIVAIAMFVLAIALIGRLSDKGYIQKTLWDDFSKDIKGNNRSKISKLNERHLIYAMAMDQSADDIDDFSSAYPSSYFPLYWGYFFMLNSSGGSVIDDSVNNSFYGYTGSSGPSGSFGAGGGFTGGGGGGAGGGGAGGF